jgi:predicted ATPase/class 3 adenylate cyclase
MPDHVGQQLGSYRLIQMLGQGHWGSVYLGEHVHLRTQAAIKLLHGPWDEREVEGFLGEARTLASLRHPHIVRVLDFGVQHGTPFLVMEYAPGGTLRQLHPKGMQLPLQIVVAYLKQVASALQYAHDQRLIHRDLKPENLLLGHDQQVWLSDFGLAIVAHSARSQPVQQTAGTLAYMAPEQLRGHATAASDQYALGVLAYEWLAGERPFSGSSTQVAVQQTLASPPLLREKVPALPPLVERVVMRALAKDPDARFPTIEAFARALEEASGEDVTGRTMPAPEAHYVAVRPSSSRGLPSGTITLLFTDIEGSTRLLQQLGARYEAVLADYRRLMRTAIEQWGGYEVDTQGDAFFVAFTRATNAVSAAMDAQRALASHAFPGGVAVRVRMGLHTGEPQRSAEGYVGLDVHHAARIMSAGHGGQVLLSQTTRDLVQRDLPDGVSLQDLGAHRLKDLQHPSHLFQLVMAGLPAAFPPLKTLDASHHNLPVQPTPFIGREQEVGAVQHLLARDGVRLLTLTGPGGTGKTRLALQVAAELSDAFPDGVFFVDLAPISDPALVVPTIAQTLGVKEVAEHPLLELVSAFLREKQVLLLLDNFEQVVEAAEQVSALLASCPQLKVLVTSREVLHVRGEQEFAVPPLALPDPKRLPDLLALSQNEAVALFIQRAQAASPKFQLTRVNATAITEICIRLDGLPLAIELAAARIKLLPPQALLARLDQRLAVLTSGARDVPERHQTLHNTIEWSYHLLNEYEQRLFQRLSVFVGGCTLEAAEAVCAALGEGDAARSVFDGMASLIDKSFLRQSEPEGQEPRLLMLETIREYGWERLNESGELEEIRHAHAAYYLHLAEHIDPHLRSAQQGVWLARLRAEHDNLRAALRWSIDHGEKEMALRLGGALWYFWELCGPWGEGRAFLEQALAASEGVAEAVRAKALGGASVLMGNLGDFEQAIALGQQSLALFRKLGERPGTALSLYSLGTMAWLRGNLEPARSLLEEALTLFRGLDDPWGIASSLISLASVALERGEYARTRALLEESLALAREQEDKRGIANALLTWAWLLFWSERALEQARAMLEESVALFREVGDRELEPLGELLLGFVAFLQGEYARARSQLEEGLALFRTMGSQRGMALGLLFLGLLSFAQGEVGTARSQLEESLALFRKMGNQSMITHCLASVAIVAVAQGQLSWGVRLLGAVETVREARGVPRPPAMQGFYEQSLASARAGLGEEASASVWAQGRAMTPEQALAAQD